jgi:hypothetical protein
MMRMNIALHDKLISLIYKNEKLQRLKKEFANRATIVDKHLQNSYGGQMDEERAYLLDLLRQKQRQLDEMKSQAEAQGQVVSGTREHVMSMRTMVRENKSELYEVRKRVDKIRPRTACGDKRPTPRSETRFVGGGFAVGGVQAPVRERSRIDEIELPGPVGTPRRRVMTATRPTRTAPKSGMQSGRPQSSVRGRK